MDVGLLGAFGVLALEDPGGDDIGWPEVLFADRADPSQGGRGPAVGAAGNLHDLVISLGGEDHRMNPFARTEPASAQGTGRLDRFRHRGWFGFSDPAGPREGQEQDGGEEGQGNGHQGRGHFGPGETGFMNPS